MLDMFNSAHSIIKWIEQMTEKMFSRLKDCWMSQCLL